MAGQVGQRQLGKIDPVADEKAREDRIAVARAQEALEAARQRIADLEGEAAYYAERAQTLWLALRGVVGESCESHAEHESGCVTCTSLALLAETEFAAQMEGATGD